MIRDNLHEILAAAGLLVLSVGIGLYDYRAGLIAGGIGVVIGAVMDSYLSAWIATRGLARRRG